MILKNLIQQENLLSPEFVVYKLNRDNNEIIDKDDVVSTCSWDTYDCWLYGTS